MFAQPMTKAEAKEIAERLHAVEILTEEGKKLMQRRIDNEELMWMRYSPPGTHTVVDDLSRASLLYELSNAFYVAYRERSGQAHMQRRYWEITDSIGNRQMTEQEEEKLSQELEEWLTNHKGARIENAITNEEDYPRRGGVISYGFPAQDFGVRQPLHPTRSTLGKTRTRTMGDLLSVGLIDERVYGEALTKLRAGELPVEHVLLQYLSERMGYYQELTENKLADGRLVDRLIAIGLLPEAAGRSLLASVSDDDLLPKFALVQLCERSRVFDLRRLPVSPVAGYQAVFDSLIDLVPGLGLDSVEIGLSPKEFSTANGPVFDLTLTLTAGGRVYTDTFYQSSSHEGDSLLWVNSGFHLSINKYLGERSSPYRLYYVQNPRDALPPYGPTEFGMLLMTEEEYTAWGVDDGDDFIRWESHDASFNHKNVQRLLLTYDSLGLFSHLIPAQIERGKSCVNTKEVSSYQDVLECFPHTIVTFDWESGNFDNPYEILTEVLAAASRGAFSPTDIIDSFGGNRDSDLTPYGFTLNGKAYHTLLPVDRDWLSGGFMQLIREALREQGVDGDFHWCVDNGQESGFIFLTGAQHTYLTMRQPSLFPTL